jgi:hypothetical protein
MIVTTLVASDFGFYPAILSLKSGDVSIETRSDFDEATSDYKNWDGVENDWIYAEGRSRVFGLPKTHTITHAHADGPEHLRFLVWVLSFFLGMRLATTEMGFVDATPITPHRLVDFTLLNKGLPTAVSLAEKFWTDHRHDPLRAKRFAAAVHALFFAQYPRHLQFEQFIYLYAALDVCYALAASIQGLKKAVPHAKRIAWLCDLFGLVTPNWAKNALDTGTEIAVLRNATAHEALFMDEPLGFAVHGVGSNVNLPLDMQCLVSRTLVAMMGGNRGSNYVQSPVNTRQRYLLDQL